jgi:hypothetical protein
MVGGLGKREPTLCVTVIDSVRVVARINDDPHDVLIQAERNGGAPDRDEFTQRVLHWLRHERARSHGAWRPGSVRPRRTRLKNAMSTARKTVGELPSVPTPKTVDRPDRAVVAQFSQQFSRADFPTCVATESCCSAWCELTGSSLAALGGSCVSEICEHIPRHHRVRP